MIQSDPLLLFNQLLLTLPSGSFIVTVLLSALAFFIASKFLDGVTINNFGTAAIVAVVVAFLDAALTEYLAADYGISVSGILSIVVNGAVILIASFFMKSFKVRGLIWAVILAFVVTLINGFLYKLIENFDVANLG